MDWKRSWRHWWCFVAQFIIVGLFDLMISGQCRVEACVGELDQQILAWLTLSEWDHAGVRLPDQWSLVRSWAELDTVGLGARHGSSGDQGRLSQVRTWSSLADIDRRRWLDAGVVWGSSWCWGTGSERLLFRTWFRGEKIHKRWTRGLLNNLLLLRLWWSLGSDTLKENC